MSFVQDKRRIIKKTSWMILNIF